MDLQPGPFLQGTKADVSVEPGVYDFTDDAMGLATTLTAIYHDWDDFVSDLPLLAAGPADPTLGIDDVGLIQEIVNETALAALPGLDTLGDSLGVGFTLLNAAVSFAPAAAFSAPSAPFVPPDPNAKIVAPLVPITLYTPDVTGLLNPPAVTPGPSVTLQNQTRVGQLNFVVGDTALITVQGNPGQTVSWDPIQNGVDLGTAVLGQTDVNGRWQLQGTIAPENVGQWFENWFLDDQLVTSFSFIVVPAGS